MKKQARRGFIALQKTAQIYRRRAAACQPKRPEEAGFTLVEVIVTMLVGSIFCMMVGIMLVMGYKFSSKTAQSMEIENNITYFRSNLEYLFRGATSDYVTISETSRPDDTLRFAAQTPTSGLTQNQFNIDNNGNMVRTYWDSSYIGGVLQPQTPWLVGGGNQVTIMPNVVSVKFEPADMSGMYGTSCITVTVVSQNNLSGGGVYSSTNTFTVTNWVGRL